MKNLIVARALSLTLLLGVVISGEGIAGEAGNLKKGEQTDSISVPEMQCGMCEMRIEKGLKKIKGVKSISADAEANIVVVTYNSKKTSREKLEEAIAALGYDAGDHEADAEKQASLPGCCRPGGHE